MRVRASSIFLVFGYLAACAAILLTLHYGNINTLFALVTMASGAFMGWAIWLLNCQNKLTVSHIIVLWLIVNGTCVLWGVLYLAATGAEQIAETLGRYVVTELLGTIGFFLAKSTVENLSINNSWPDKPKGKSGESDEYTDL